MNKQVVSAVVTGVAIVVGVTIARIRMHKKQMRDLQDMQKAVDAFGAKVKSGEFTKELVQNVKNRQMVQAHLVYVQVRYERMGSEHAGIAAHLFRAEQLVNELSKSYDDTVAQEILGELKKAEAIMTVSV